MRKQRDRSHRNQISFEIDERTSGALEKIAATLREQAEARGEIARGKYHSQAIRLALLTYAAGLP